MVAEYLRARLASCPRDAQAHLAAVAGRYDSIAQLLKPFAVWEPGTGYRAGEGTGDCVMGDLSRQYAHAEAVLRPIKVHLAAAADEIERALAIRGLGSDARHRR